MKLNKKLLMTALLLCSVSSGVMVAVAEEGEEGEVWQQGGLATNQVSSGMAQTQQSLSVATAMIGTISNSLIVTRRFFPETYASLVCTPPPPAGTGNCMGYNFSGMQPFYFNSDFAGLSLDAMQLYDAHTRKAQWSDDIPELQATVRQIGGLGDIEAECENIKKSGRTGGFYCNMVSATLDGTEVHASTLKNVGLEALEDVDGTAFTKIEELLRANPTIQTGFGSKTSFEQSTQNGSTILWSNYITDYGASGNKDGSTDDGNSGANEPTEAERQKINLRRNAHIQLVGTAGVARADLASSIAASERAQFGRLSTYIGSAGGSIVANAKVLVSLDLTLAQRLNLLNMVQGQQVANEAASALQMLE